MKTPPIQNTSIVLIVAIGFVSVLSIALGAETLSVSPTSATQKESSLPGRSPSSAGIQNNEKRKEEFVSPSSLTCRFIKEKSAQLYPIGFKQSPKDSKNKPFAVMATRDPNAVFHGEPVYFSMKTGTEIHYSIESEKPLTKLVYTGVAFFNFSLSVLDENGKVIANTGPYNFKNTENRIELVLPNITRFELILKSNPITWVLTKEIRFSAEGRSSLNLQKKPETAGTPTTNTGNTSTPADRIKQFKLLLDQGAIKQDEYDRRVKEILDAI